MTSWVPLCMDASEYASWREMNLRVAGNNQAKRPCEDCPLGYAADMRTLGRCNGEPGGVEEEEEVKIEELKAKATIVPVVISIPCERCVHREVCAIRQSIDDLDEVETELPALSAALKPTLTMAIECGFFLAERKKGPGRPAGRALTDAERSARTENVKKAQAAAQAARLARHSLESPA